MVPRGSPEASVSMRTQRIGSSTVPKSYGYVSVQSSIRQTLLQSSFDPVTALHFRAPQLPTWVSALSSTPSRRSRSVDVPRSTGVCPRRSQPFGDFCNTTCELVSSRSRAQDNFSFRGLSTSSSIQPSSDWNCTHAVELPHAHLQAGCHARVPRLRCFSPHKAAVQSVR